METPSNFCSYPWSSVFQKTENEIVAQNIMKILQRTGDTFRSLSWEEYETERQKDKNFSIAEKKYFNEVLHYCESAEKAKTFSESWNKL
ncbi:hypothetical protein U9K52_09900 [Chryseobacterium sp. MHB01]|uniref:hypothetical protein n=1 Tax=Chryseobacterium sp. MHB01 TaxID=3109433 RepID=UPI002AFF599E|nr:hypothetical protein [Chryseobacterium sp. MHB01]MEA1849225.1 hypothetical protein [Chryseobacterium sp. MHB01]